ncbi:hypothetical protein H312_02609 [Anncaliia algerae PRA339]|uniref:Uncharacterized protein n=1 Tax=Anncaliia algerae PRA339 TaxID=1288291 RepID=A0A059EY78_9MICR|nr:hypothetical protein H312_02609 [Anncaliia algerae PRA339]
MNKIYLFLIALTIPFYIQNKYALMRQIKHLTKNKEAEKLTHKVCHNEVIINIFLNRKSNRINLRNMLNTLFNRKSKELIRTMKIPTDSICNNSVDAIRNNGYSLFKSIRLTKILNNDQKTCGFIEENMHK